MQYQYFRYIILSMTLVALSCGEIPEDLHPDGDDTNSESNNDNESDPSRDLAGYCDPTEDHGCVTFDYKTFDLLDDQQGVIFAEIRGAGGYKFQHGNDITYGIPGEELRLKARNVNIGTYTYYVKIVTPTCSVTLSGSGIIASGEVDVIELIFSELCNNKSKTQATESLTLSDASELFYIGVRNGKDQEFVDGSPIGYSVVHVEITRTKAPIVLALASSYSTEFKINKISDDAKIEAVILSGLHPLAVTGLADDTKVYYQFPSDSDSSMPDLSGEPIETEFEVFDAYEDDSGLLSKFENGTPKCIDKKKTPNSRWYDARATLYQLTDKEILGAYGLETGHTFHITNHSQIWDLKSADEPDKSCQ